VLVKLGTKRIVLCKKCKTIQVISKDETIGTRCTICGYKVIPYKKKKKNNEDKKHG